jgi:hypothetical protein
MGVTAADGTVAAAAVAGKLRHEPGNSCVALAESGEQPLGVPVGDVFLDGFRQVGVE